MRPLSPSLGVLLCVASGAAHAQERYLQSVLFPAGLGYAEAATVLRQQNVAGDGELDVLSVRPMRDGSHRLEIWERGVFVDRRRFSIPSVPGAPADGFMQAVGTGLPAEAIDVQGLYLPGGVVGASRDLAVLSAQTVGNLRFFRNRGPDTTPRFAADQTLTVPGAQRLHYFPLIPIPPGSPGYLAYPLAISTVDGGIRVVEVGDQGQVELRDQILQHAGGARDVLVLNYDGEPRLLSVGAAPARLWTPATPAYTDAVLDLPGLPVDADAVQAVLGEFDGQPSWPDLVLAFDDGQLLRWDGIAPVSGELAFGPAQAVASGLDVHDLVELTVGVDASARSALLVVAEPESRLYPVQQGVVGQPFATQAQILPAARAAAGDIGLSLLALGRVSGGVDIYQRNGVIDTQTPFSVGWASDEPIPVADRLFVAEFSAPVASEFDYSLLLKWRGSNNLPLPVGASGGEGLGGSPLFPFSAGATRELAFAALSNSPTDASFLIELDSNSSAPLREPLQRSGFLLPPRCTEGSGIEERLARCIATCYNNVQVPAHLAAVPTAKGLPRFLDAAGLQTLYDLRDQVFATTAKGREYSALYAQYSQDIYAALLSQPSAFLDYVAARDAWLPAIRALVDGQPFAIDADMLARLDVIAAHLRQHGSAELRDVVDREYALLDPRSLLGADVQVLRERYEGLPQREVFDDGFENLPP